MKVLGFITVTVKSMLAIALHAPLCPERGKRCSRSIWKKFLVPRFKGIPGVSDVAFLKLISSSMSKHENEQREGRRHDDGSASTRT